MSELKHHYRVSSELRSALINSLPIAAVIKEAIESERVATIAINVDPLFRVVFTPTETFASFRNQAGDMTHLTPCAETDIPAWDDEDDEEDES